MCQNGQFSKSVWLKLVISINSRVLNNWVAIDHLLRKMQRWITASRKIVFGNYTSNGIARYVLMLIIRPIDRLCQHNF